MIRRLHEKDIPLLKDLRVEWEFGPDCVSALVAVDENDKPIAFAAAWKRAEVHAALDPKFSTPGARLAVLRELHDAVEKELSWEGFKEAVTWFDDKPAKEAKRFQKRMSLWGWVKSQKTSWHRGIR